MPRINEHTFSLEDIVYKLRYYQNKKPIIYVNENVYEGNKSALLRKYINQLELGVNLDKLTTQQLSGIVLKYFTKQNNDQLKKISPKLKSSKVERTKKPKTKKQNLPIDEKTEEPPNSLFSEKLKDKKTPKLLIIGCCDAKSLQPNNLANSGKVNYKFGDAINNLRVKRLDFYRALSANHFANRPNGGQQYYIGAVNDANRREALEVYGSSRSPFYKQAMKKLYKETITKCNLHLLIVSGLYGILRHDDYINDYNLTINKGKKCFWGDVILNATSKYIEENNIDHSCVFYSLSDEYKFKLKPLKVWNNLWLNRPGHGQNQANDLNIFLTNMLI